LPASLIIFIAVRCGGKQKMKYRPEVRPFIGISIGFGLVVAALGYLLGLAYPWFLIMGLFLGSVSVVYMLHFFRDPDMKIPHDVGVVVSGASGVLAQVKEVYEDKVFKGPTTRISIFLSLVDVHVNRAPIAGRAHYLGYFPGRRLFTFDEKSSEVNQHNSILIEGEDTRVLVRQIVGPVARRVVYFLDPNASVEVERGERIGMMKFGSRLDMYFPKGDIEVVANIGEQVHAGQSIIARIKRG
jgi:phosphatidylserine decarboxylase